MSGRRGERCHFLIAVGMVALLCLVGCYNEEEAIAENEAIAVSIITALELYEQAYGAYPDTLDELSPEFMDQIPLTVDGEVFGYRGYSSAEYGLAFSLRSGLTCGYLPRSEVWECSDYGDH